MSSKNLLDLFNQDVDFVKQVGDFEYRAVEWPKFATHHLVATRWNTRKEYKPNSKGRYVMVDGYALAVVAEPMRVRLHRTAMVVRACFPKRGAPIFRHDAELKGKRAVLRYLMEAMQPVRHSVWKRKLMHMDTDDCDMLYTNLIRASRKYEAERRARAAARRAKTEARKLNSN